MLLDSGEMVLQASIADQALLGKASVSVKCFMIPAYETCVIHIPILQGGSTLPVRSEHNDRLGLERKLRWKLRKKLSDFPLRVFFH